VLLGVSDGGPEQASRTGFGARTTRAHGHAHGRALKFWGDAPKSNLMAGPLRPTVLPPLRPRVLSARAPAEEAPRRVLVVDDDPLVGEGIRRLLADHETPERLDAMRQDLFGEPPPAPPLVTFDVTVANQGREAKELVLAACKAGRPYALAFVDMQMPPGWDGVETIGHLWSVDPELRVVIYTAHSNFRWDDVVHTLGRSDGLHLLRKPLPPELITRTAAVLTTKALRDRRQRCA
jgi:CheY-like chemotaxis protein